MDYFFFNVDPFFHSNIASNPTIRPFGLEIYNKNLFAILQFLEL